jgi:hypothetical protein
MDDLDEGRGLRTMGSLEGSVGSGRVGWAGGIRDCAMANVLLPITIQDAKSVGSIAAGPGGAGSAGGLSPLHGQGRKGSYGFPRASAGGYSPLAPSGLEPPGAPWMQGELVATPQGSPGLEALERVDSGATVIQMADVGHHRAWMERTMAYEFNTFALIFEYNGKMWTRISGQIYLELRDFEWLGGVLKELCHRIRAGENMRPDNDRLSRAKSRGTPGSSASGVDLEALGRTVSEVRLGPSLVPPARRRFGSMSASTVEV